MLGGPLSAHKPAIKPACSSNRHNRWYGGVFARCVLSLLLLGTYARLWSEAYPLVEKPQQPAHQKIPTFPTKSTPKPSLQSTQVKQRQRLCKPLRNRRNLVENGLLSAQRTVWYPWYPTFPAIRCKHSAKNLLRMEPGSVFQSAHAPPIQSSDDPYRDLRSDCASLLCTSEACWTHPYALRCAPVGGGVDRAPQN